MWHIFICGVYSGARRGVQIFYLTLPAPLYTPQIKTYHIFI